MDGTDSEWFHYLWSRSLIPWFDCERKIKVKAW